MHSSRMRTSSSLTACRGGEGVRGRGHAWQGIVHGRGGCTAGGWGAFVRDRGACMAGGHALHACSLPRMPLPWTDRHL